MEFNEKLQELRKKKGLTQDELAEILFVSRAAISKWESGRGYPNIDSLKAIARFYRVTIDELLSGEELLSIAEEDTRQKENHFRDLLFGLLDCSAVIYVLLPFFGQRVNGAIQSVPLFSVDQIAPYLRTAYIVVVIGVIAFGLMTLALQNCRMAFWLKNKHKISLAINAFATLLFIVGSQPYAATFLFVFLAIKVLTLIKW